MSSKIAKALELSRQELLDIGLRGNTLLHFKPRAHSLSIIDEVSKEIYKILVENQRTMSFLPIPKGMLNNEENISEALPELLEEKLGTNRHSDNKLQTKLNQDQLDKKLLKINTEADTFYQEQGIDILYVALGFLSWYEDDNSEIERRAPLILIPVSLTRSTAQERFKLKYTQVDLGTNLTLKAKLKSDYTIELPEFNDEIDITEYYKKVKNVIKKQERWKIIEDEIHLGFFKFGKFQMYQDLDAKGWPEDKKPDKHSIIQSLFGEGFYNSNEKENKNTLENDVVKELQNLENFHFIADADSSQTEAILKIKKGKNLVIQGPPGTGKSQTITNIISESLADHKKILFVSEKMVALEVVKRRLDNCHLGDAVLELHSHKSNKRVVLEDIKRTLELGEPEIDNRTIQIARYKEIQKRLDDYSEATNQPILKSGINFVEAVGHLLHYKLIVDKFDLKEIQIESLETWSKNKIINAITLINDLIAYIEEYGPASKSFFSESKIDNFSPADESFIELRLTEIIEDIPSLKNEVLKLIELIPIKPEISLIEIQKLINTANYLESIPNLETVNFSSSYWLIKENEIRNIIENGKKQKSIYTKYSDVLIDDAFDYNIFEVRNAYAATGGKWWRFLSAKYRRAQKTLKSLLKSELPSLAKCNDYIENILAYQEAGKQIQKKNKIGSSLFGNKWDNLNSNWGELEEIFIWLTEFYKKISKEEISEEVVPLLSELDIKFISKQKKKVTSSNKRLIIKINEFYKKIEIEENISSPNYYKNMDLDLLQNQMVNMQNNKHQLFTIARYNRIRKKLNDKGLSLVGDLSYDWCHDPIILLNLFKYSWYKSLVNKAYENRDAIKYFDSNGHSKDIKEFKKLDNELFHFAQEQLTMNHFKNLPSTYAPGEMALIRREINKKKRHLPLRQLLLKAGNAVQQIKPVFMMSPMSVSTFLAQGALEFDLVIFDEASQVKVVDALIPILRGKQIVVVGDSKQMPPTDFFSRTFENEEDEEENRTGDIESILGMFLAQGAYESMLKWHYRSRHDSLINVSNQEFYDGRLMVFPSSGTNKEATGLKFNHIPESIYERGTSRTNPYEALVVATAVMSHAKNKPELTLGVVAFSTAQRDCIIMELERLRREDPSCEKFFSRSNLEEFFVKNLENVQGDERDIIYISIGYGKTAHRKVTSSFGPVNREGGERRLNVLITRARLGMEVFSNFTADDLETKSTTPFGVRALKSFLKYAETGHLENRHETGKETDSPFEDEVISAIKGLGYDPEPQVGSAGFFIDIAVKDPLQPGKYILAVECDGASYHSSASARDRDRLRQNVLENMGWKFHRIWSTDWFRTPKRQIELLKTAIEEAIKQSQPESELSDFQEIKKKQNAISRTQVEQTQPEQIKYKVIDEIPGLNYLDDILVIPKYILADYIKSIISYEGAMHIKDVAKRITEAVGVGRMGSRILDSIQNAVKYGHRDKLFFVSKDFIYPDELKKVEIRDRSELPNNLKHIEHIPPEEIQQAIIETVGMAFSISESEVISEALSQMGFNRSTEKARNIIIKGIKVLIKKNKVKFDNDKLMII